MTLDFLSGDHHISLRHWVWHSAIPLHHLGGSRGPAAGRHGLQLLCGICYPLCYSILTFVLLRPQVSDHLCPHAACILAESTAHCLDPCSLYCASPFLCCQRNPSLFCEITTLLKLVCAHTAWYEKGLFVSGVIFLLPPISAIMASHGSILSIVLLIDSRLGLRRT